MASKIDAADLSLFSIKGETQTASSLRFDWTMVGVSVWWLGGLFIDGWAHSNIPQLETFFTPWHAVLYSGFLAVALTLIVKTLQNLRQLAGNAHTGAAAPSLIALVRSNLRGNRWTRAIPSGYGLSLLGVLVFGISGIGDMTWHLIFGIERSTEALLSPTHLGLATGIALALSGPLRAAWRRSNNVSSWHRLGAAIFSLTFTFSLLTFFTEYASPLINPWPIMQSGNTASRGITGILLTTGLMMGFVLLALRRWRLPFGAFTLILGLNGVLMAAFAPVAITVSLPTTLLGGLAADLVYRSLQPSLDQPASVRLFAFLVPAMFYVLYFIDLAFVGPAIMGNGILWSIPFWAGAPVIAGFAGFLLSYVMIPPERPSEKKDETIE